MAAFSTYIENKILDAVLKNTSYTSTATYVALYTTGTTEVSGGSYARVQLNTSMASAASGSSTTNADLNFPTATANWGSVGGFGIYDASSGGNLLVSGTLSVAKTISTGDTLTIPSGDLSVSLT